MVRGLVVVDFVDGNSSVYDGWLDSFLLDDRLNSLRHGSMTGQHLNRELYQPHVRDGGHVLQQSLVPQSESLEYHPPSGYSGIVHALVRDVL